MNVLEKIGLKYLINKLSSKFVTKAYLDSQLGMASDLEARINSVENLVKIQNSSSGWFNIPEFMYDHINFHPSSNATNLNGAFQLNFLGNNHLRTRGSFISLNELDLSDKYIPIYNIPINWLDDQEGVYVRGGYNGRFFQFIKKLSSTHQNYIYSCIVNGQTQTTLANKSWIPLGNIDYYLSPSQNEIILDANYMVGCDFSATSSSSKGFIYTTTTLFEYEEYNVGIVDPVECSYLNNLSVAMINGTVNYSGTFYINSDTGVLSFSPDHNISSGAVFNAYKGGTWNGF